MLAIADRLIAAQLTQLNTALSAQPSSLTRAGRALATADCSPDTSNKAIDALLCEREVYHDTLTQQSSAAQSAGASLYAGAALGDVAGWVAVGLSQAGARALTTTQALQLLWSAAVPYMANFAILKPAPALSAPLASAFLQVVDTGLAHGLPVTSEAVTAIKAYQGAANISKASASEPQGGLLISAPTTNTAAQPQAVLAFQSPPKTLSVPTTQATTSVTQSTIPTPAVSRFEGSYPGTSSGSVRVTLLMTVSPNGVIQITVEGAQGSGNVSVEGGINLGNIRFPTATCTFGARFTLLFTGGSEVAGMWVCSDGALGRWKAAR